MVQHIKEIGIRAVGGGFSACKGYFSSSINQGSIRPEDVHLINGIIPGAMIDGRGGAPVLEGHDPTKIQNTVTLLEIKGLATVHGEAAQQRT